ncbi:Hsp70 family protein [Mesorhizobium sp. L-8-3]|uniref:Hsp70 family protein n=1 Tax=Mesorhizobium sp. L-8-3 TaxID=2744522 RepID=UPI001926B85C|nr:Hsp70 family protein [Mesorhizobium sp. L-8-3]BCH20477.1 heat-shock protein [Mesorhizobium sp. L-8-3]
MKPISGGIDFGTSNSTVGYMEAGRPRLVPLENGNATMPSAVFFNFEDNRTYFGRQAIGHYTDNVEGRLLRALKSVLGTSLINEKTRIKAHQIAFSDIIGSFLHTLKEALDNQVGQPVDHVVLGRPVHFVDDDAEADRRAQDELEKAATKRGFRHIAFQFEPIAAALDYEQTVRREELALIIDIGGGTSDFSIVRVSPERARAADRKDDILASTGVHIGGTDFDRLLSMTHLMPELGYKTETRDGKRYLPAGYFHDLATWQRINLLYTARAMTDLRQIRYEAARPELVERMIDIVRHRQGHALAGRIEAAKIDLTDQTETVMEIALTDETMRAPMTRAGLEGAIEAAVGRVGDTALQTLQDAGVEAGSITTLFLTGGSTAIPLLKRRMLALFPEATAVEGDLFGSVGLGLALDAQRKFGRF